MTDVSPVRETTRRDQAGRFRKGRSGNPAGRPRGARNAATVAAEALLDGEAESLTRKAIDLAHGGDMTAMRLVLERILPARKDRPVAFTLPAIRSLIPARNRDHRRRKAAITAAAKSGGIDAEIRARNEPANSISIDRATASDPGPCTASSEGDAQRQHKSLLSSHDSRSSVQRSHRQPVSDGSLTNNPAMTRIVHGPRSATLLQGTRSSDAEGAWVWKDACEAVEVAQVLFLQKFGPAITAQSAAAANTGADVRGSGQASPGWGPPQAPWHQT